MAHSELQKQVSCLIDSSVAALERSMEACQETSAWGIYGAGRIGRKLATALAARGKQVQYFLDSKAGELGAVDGVMCVTKEAATDAMKRVPIAVAIHNPQADSTLIKAQLKALGFDKVLLIQEVVDFLPEVANFWLAPRSISIQAKADLIDAAAHFEDEQSQKTFLAVLGFRLLGEQPLSPEPDQYFPASLPAPKTPLRFVDAGAFDGDTLDYIVARKLPMDLCMAFEPDLANYAAVVAKHRTRATIIPCALSDSTGFVSFTSDGSAGHVGEGDVRVRTVPLDASIVNMEVNFIKMDIEGAEPQALRGARGIISRWQPRLAIASYHDPLHMIQLPALLREIGYRGSFHLRCHAWNTFETVLYGIEPRS